MSALLRLPSEIRHQIWSLVFNDTTAKLGSSDHGCVPVNCRACSVRSKDLDSYPWATLADTILVNKQYYHETKPYFVRSIQFVFSDQAHIKRLYCSGASSNKMRHVEKVLLLLHITGETGMEWNRALMALVASPNCPKQLTIHNHMRPPTSYEALTDAIFLAIGLLGIPASTALTLQFDYTFEDVMFSSPFLGDVRCSDALQEHEQVIRELLTDGEFKAAANGLLGNDGVPNWESMTSVLLRVARRYEQPWFQRLQRRRLEALAREEDPGPGVSSADEDDERNSSGSDSDSVDFSDLALSA